MTVPPQSKYQLANKQSPELNDEPSLVTVYYDGKCGLCQKEISHYKKIADDGQFVWSDIAHDATPLSLLGVSQMAALRRLHATDSNGRLHIGVDAFILIWQQLPRWHLLAILVGIPVLRQTAAIFYDRFADYRFARLEHCKISVNEEKVKQLLVK